MKRTSRNESPYRVLIDRAEEALAYAYAPYSHFHVGAALFGADGKVWSGCNIENASFTAGICAERTALFKAVSEGQIRFRALVVVGQHEGESTLTEEFTAPCGVCRQALSEFCPSDMPVILVNAEDEVMEYTLGELLPAAFGSEHLE